MLLVGVAGLVAIVGGSGHSATSRLLEYQTRALAVVVVGAAVGAWWWAERRGQEWGFEVVPAAAGAVGAMALIGALKGTPYGPNGLGGDQTFRTAAITRFADSWHNADFTTEGLPSAYPPAYFWVLGRLSALVGVEPWRMAKIGAIVVALAIPMFAFVLWRRLVDPRRAALLAVVPVVVENFYEPYGWVVMVAIVPWWLEVVHGLRRPGTRPGNPIWLGVVGALLFMTYFYFFVVAALAFAVYLVTERVIGTPDRRHLRRAIISMATVAVVSAVFWLPVAISVLRAEHAESLANRWFGASHPQLPLPMTELSLTGVASLSGLGYLVWRAERDPLARGLLVLLASVYLWYLVGAVAALVDQPLLSFRAKPLIPSILLTAGTLALVDIGGYALSRWDRRDVSRVTVVVAMAFGVFVSQEFVTGIRDSSYIEAARSTPRPAESPPDPSTESLQQLIETRVGDGAVLLSDRVDVLVLYPNHAFVTWDAHYANPASEFSQRIRFLRDLASLDDPAAFAAQVADNRFGRIDALVLLDEGDELVFRYTADAFPNGSSGESVRFPRTRFSEFVLEPVGDHVLAITP